MTALRCLIAAVVSLMLFAPSVHAQNYDIVILNGRVMDPETKFDGVVYTGCAALLRSFKESHREH
jgi:hypothetical protein